MEAGTKIEVKRNYGTVCDNMTGIVISIKEKNALIKFNDGEVELPLDSLMVVPQRIK